MRFRCVELAAFALLAFPAAQAAGFEDNVRESWEAAYQGKQKIGWQKTIVDRVDVNGQAVMHTQVDCRVSIRRFSDSATMQLRIDAFELLDGRLYAFDSSMAMGGIANKTSGRLKKSDEFHLTIDTPGKKTEQTIPWEPGVLGPYAYERLLREKPMKVGETRSYKTFLPEANQIATMTLAAVRQESTELTKGKSRELLRVESTNDKVPLNTVFWLDADGMVLKSSTPFIGTTLDTFRVTKAEALDQSGDSAEDLGYASLVRPNKPITDPHNHRRAATYKLVFEEEKAAGDFPDEPYQRVLSRSGKEVRVKMTHVAPTRGGKSGEPAPEFLAPNGFLQSDNPAIVAATKEAVGESTDPWQKAVKIERWVHDHVTRKDFTVGFATAGEVIETRRGDCTEHAVLVAAMCKAAGVPARVAMGLVYLESGNSFGYHMWTEVYIRGQWIPIDGTLGQGGIGAGHIKLGDSSLKGASALSAFLPIFNVIGKLKIEVESVE